VPARDVGGLDARYTSVGPILFKTDSHKDHMFASISFDGLQKSKNFKYAAELPFFVGRKEMEFSTGLTVLFGPNGCGKTTLLRMLADTLCATQGGRSMVTESVVREFLEVGEGARDPVGLKLVHDGQPVLFCDPRATVGLASGHLDDDFFDEGLAEALGGKRASHGQNGARRINRTLDVLSGRKPVPAEIPRWKDSSSVNSLWAEAIDLVEARLVASIPRGPMTILLDEPESNFSMFWQSKIWSLLGKPEVLERFQVIVASHSVFGLGIPDANYVEFEPGYVARATEVLTEKAEALLATRA
jgi:predicted ATPase